MTTGTRTYQDAIVSLNTLQSNAAALEALRNQPKTTDTSLSESVEFLRRIGYQQSDLNRLNVIHITGTKGKGSACAFTDSILRHAVPSWTVGLYTSPHLVSVRERIRINGVPLSEEEFTKYFYEVWDRLEENPPAPYEPRMPMYFRYMTLVAFHTFFSLKVDATILEVGIGGLNDITNIVPEPIATGVTSLGIDHVGVLGHTLGEIARHKGGIYKEGVPAFTVAQPVEGLEVLRGMAKERKASEFSVLQPIEALRSIKLGLPGIHQLSNATMAVSLCHTFLKRKAPPTIEIADEPTSLSPAFIAGLENARWPGRCQQVVDPVREKIRWFLDGAHTNESLRCCVDWYVSPDVGLRAMTRPKRVLIFNCTKGRSGSEFLGTILEHISQQLRLYGSQQLQDAEGTLPHGAFFDHVIFCANVTYANGSFKGDLTSTILKDEADQLATQKEIAAAWASLVPGFPASNIHVLPSIEHAVKVVRDLETKVDGGDVDVLVTGSLHLVGGTIEVAGLAEVAL
ncbi:hypothetical protein BOTBODRAFT_26515 [Botryobasidium botryosum FD-172 SS1]|uniref:Folylpolyglutamate synthase n=1 Tax=Botryobasidium botryosum (strain FD-172 SS1) TaxID=930990 RepID=A0A067MXL2_BOTB1|nr:hypothetical protein BOTBODRAFT_26515 [Botryobasidium botryosum FD-172 SS1]